jgi:hypothetical protein
MSYEGKNKDLNEMVFSWVPIAWANALPRSYMSHNWYSFCRAGAQISSFTSWLLTFTLGRIEGQVSNMIRGGSEMRREL